jgi:hypothetical protein
MLRPTWLKRARPGELLEMRDTACHSNSAEERDCILQKPGLVKVADGNGLEAGVAHQPFGDRRRTAIARVERAWPDPLVVDLVVEKMMYEVKRLDDWPRTIALTSCRERLIGLIAPIEGVGLCRSRPCP